MENPRGYFQQRFLREMQEMLDAAGLSERWILNEKETFIWGLIEEDKVDEFNDEPFYWEYCVQILEKDGLDAMEIYGYDEGTCGVDYFNGGYVPHSLNFNKSGFNVYLNGRELENMKKGSDAAIFRGAFESWLDSWYEDWYGDKA